MEDIIDLATRAREIICHNKQVRPISMMEYSRVKTKLKMNKANDLSGWKNEFNKHTRKDLESGLFKMLIEVVRHVTIHKVWDYVKIK